MKQYLDLLRDVRDNGVDRDDRTGVGTRGVFGRQIRFDLADGFPLLTTKKLHTRSIFHELIWFLAGDTNIKYLQDNNVHIWDKWADENGELGPIYGKQWRRWAHYENSIVIDQIQNLVDGLKKDPNGRRHIVTAWNPESIRRMALVKRGLPPCHCLFQFFVAEGKLSCQLYQRSADIFLGVPFNIASYALLTHMVAQVVGLELGEFVHTFGDLHLYKNHFDQAAEQLSRTPLPLPSLGFNRTVTDIFDFKYEDIHLASYHPREAIKAPIAV